MKTCEPLTEFGDTMLCLMTYIAILLTSIFLGEFKGVYNESSVTLKNLKQVFKQIDVKKIHGDLKSKVIIHKVVPTV